MISMRPTNTAWVICTLDRYRVFYRVSQKKMVTRKGFEFFTLGGVFLGVKNNSKNFGNKKI